MPFIWDSLVANFYAMFDSKMLVPQFHKPIVTSPTVRMNNAFNSDTPPATFYSTSSEITFISLNLSIKRRGKFAVLSNLFSNSNKIAISRTPVQPNNLSDLSCSASIAKSFTICRNLASEIFERQKYLFSLVIPRF